jgi:hypothetical protein
LEGKPASVERALSIDNADARERKQAEKHARIGQFGVRPGDTGSTPVQGACCVCLFVCLFVCLGWVGGWVVGRLVGVGGGFGWLGVVCVLGLGLGLVFWGLVGPIIVAAIVVVLALISPDPI